MEQFTIPEKVRKNTIQTAESFEQKQKREIIILGVISMQKGMTSWPNWMLTLFQRKTSLLKHSVTSTIFVLDLWELLKFMEIRNSRGLHGQPPSKHLVFMVLPSGDCLDWIWSFSLEQIM